MLRLIKKTKNSFYFHVFIVYPLGQGSFSDGVRFLNVLPL
jgi:hypothetical protein